MNSQEFARTILFGSNIEEKLIQPENLILGSELIGSCEVPVRPRSLMFESRSEQLPSLNNIETDEQKARLLHFFANHELLAIELMALALARFTDAAESFRKGIFNTILEEQNHFSLYRSAINELGYEFGDFPVNGFFWKILSGMNSPIEYVSKMSLTFEQANLDYCIHYISLFQKTGDQEIVKILQRVYQEEIGHVRFGVRWFEKLSGKPLDFENFQQNLNWPMTAVWAKGKAFSKDARVAAGLSKAFIEDLELFHRTRGRAPNIFMFYPGAENHCFGAPKAPPPKMFIEMWEDLQIIPYFLARTDDAVLVSKKPSRTHLRRLRSYGFPAVEFVNGYDVNFNGAIPDSDDRKFNSLQPWGWDSFIGKKFSNLYFAKEHPKTQNFQSWYSKVNILGWINSICSEENAEFLIGSENLGVPIDQGSDIVELITKWPSYGKFVIKGEFGYSGLSQRIIKKEDSSEHIDLALKSILSKQKTAILEPWYDKEFDYSVQIDVTVDGSYLFRGLARFLTDSKGRYVGAKLGRFDQGLSQQVVEFIHRYPLPFEDMTQKIASELHKLGYHGPAGIDGLVLRQKDGELKHRFGLEVNPRWNMGRLAVELQNKMAPGRVGLWKLIDRSEVSSFESFVLAAEKAFPAKLTRGFLDQGVFVLTDPETASRKLGVVLVAGKENDINYMVDQLSLQTI